MSISRHIKRSAFALLALSAFTSAQAATTPRIGVQLWSVKDEIKQDFEGTLTKIAALGFQGVEFAGEFGRFASDAPGLKAFLEKNTHHLLYKGTLFIGISHERKTMDWGKIYSLGGNKWHEKKMFSIRFKDNGESLKRGDVVMGRTVTAKVEKKLSPADKKRNQIRADAEVFIV